MKLSIVIPCYNESESLNELFDACLRAVKGREDVEIIFVNNGSTDGSETIFAEFGSRYDCARIINVEKNIGYGYGILQGLEQASGDVLAWTHADLQVDMADVIKAYDAYSSRLENHAVLIKGARNNRPFLDVFFTSGMSVFAWLMLGVRMRDINAPPKLFNRRYLSLLGKAPNDFSLDTYLLYRASKAGLKIMEYPVNIAKRLFGEAKGGGSFKGKIKLTIRTVKFLFRLRNTVGTKLWK